MFSHKPTSQQIENIKLLKDLGEAADDYRKTGRIRDYAREDICDGTWLINNCQSQQGVDTLKSVLLGIGEGLKNKRDGAQKACDFLGELFSKGLKSDKSNALDSQLRKNCAEVLTQQNFQTLLSNTQQMAIILQELYLKNSQESSSQFTTRLGGSM